MVVAINDHKLIVEWSSQSLSRGCCARVNAAGLAAVGSPHYHGSKSQSRGQAADQASIHCWIDGIDRLSGLVFAIKWGLLSVSRVITKVGQWRRGQIRVIGVKTTMSIIESTTNRSRSARSLRLSGRCRSRSRSKSMGLNKLERYSHGGYLIKVVVMAVAGEVARELSPILSWSNNNYKV